MCWSFNRRPESDLRIQKISDGRKEFRLPRFKGMNSTFMANDHSLQQKKKASKFLKATLQKKTFIETLKKSSIVNTRT